MSSCVCSASPVSVCPLYGTPSSNDAGFGFSPLMCPVAKLDLISLIAFANDIVLPSRTNSNVSCSAFSPAADTLSAASGDDAESSTDLTMCLMYLKRQPFSFRHASAASLSTAASAAATQFLPVTCVERSSAPFLSLPVIGKTRPSSGGNDLFAANVLALGMAARSSEGATGAPRGLAELISGRGGRSTTRSPTQIWLEKVSWAPRSP